MKILVADDDEVTRNLLREVLLRAGFEVALAASGEEAVERIRAEIFPIVLSDIRMIELDGMSVLREAKLRESRTAVILMTGFGSMEGAIEAIRHGAFDYVSKPFNLNDLRAVIARAAKHWESLAAKPVSSTSPMTASRTRAIIGKSPKIVDVYKTLARASLSSSNILIAGERGTGKKLIARAIHENSSRREHRFVAVSSGSLDEAHLEAEIFGRAGGRGGAWADAVGGTLFLDEVGDLPAGLQVRIMEAVGDGDETADVRLIAATHGDPESLVRDGKLREDLYYRLKVIEMNVPPLRERSEDLPELVEHFISRHAERNHKAVSHVSEEAMRALMAYSWPGNVRELENVIERAVAMTSTAVLFPEDFPPEVRAGSIAAIPAAEASGGRTSLEEVERAHILRVLQEAGFNKSKASEILGIDRATLYRKAGRYGIDLKAK